MFVSKKQQESGEVRQPARRQYCSPWRPRLAACKATRLLRRALDANITHSIHDAASAGCRTISVDRTICRSPSQVFQCTASTN